MLTAKKYVHTKFSLSRKQDIIIYPNLLEKYENDIFRELDALDYENTLFRLGTGSNELPEKVIWFCDNPNWTYVEYEKKKNPIGGIPARPFPDFIKQIKFVIENLTGFDFNACLVNKYMDGNDTSKWYKNEDNNIVIPIISFGDDRKLIFRNKDSTTKSVKVASNSLILIPKSVHNNWEYSTQKEKKKKTTFFLTFKNIVDQIPKYLPMKLKDIYLSIDYRSDFSQHIQDYFNPIHDMNIPVGNQCVKQNGLNVLSQYVILIKLLGTGDWGNVFSACLPSQKKVNKCLPFSNKFAIKMARIDDKALEHPYTPFNRSWFEVLMLRDIIKPIIINKICPNLPLLIDTFICNKCDFVLRNKQQSHPCVIMVTELADGDFKDFLMKENPSKEEIYSALFQIMAGLTAIQIYGQIMNNDIKARNILFYNVTPGGYWHYKIESRNFYVPNFGKLFVLNDFGVSTLYHPNLQMYNTNKTKTYKLGSRYAINKRGRLNPIESNIELGLMEDFWGNKKLDFKKTPKINWVNKKSKDNKISRGAVFRLDRKTDKILLSKTTITSSQKRYLHKHNITTNPKKLDFFKNAWVVPPFEFYNDTQDAIRMIIGGKRATQRGDHKKYPIVTQDIVNSLKPYIGLTTNAKGVSFFTNSYYILAGEFIKKFFKDVVDYTKKPKGRKIETYKLI